MINVNKSIEQAYDESTTQVDKIIVDGKEYRITNVQFYDDCYDEGNIFGTAIAKALEFEIENTINLEKKEFEYCSGIFVKGSVQWISLGNFITQDIEPNDTTNTTKVTAIDYMIKTNIPYKTKLPYQDGKTTLLQVLQEVCTNSELILATTNFANDNFIVDSNQFSEGTLNRQVIQAVAQISGTVAKIKNNNHLYLINPNEVTTISKVFTLNNYKEAEIKRTTHPINLVSLGMQDVEGENVVLRDEESIAKDGENNLVINDNPFAYTQAKREQLITALFNAVKGFEYKSYKFDCQAVPYLETMDKIQFLDKQGNTYNSFIFRFNYKSPNGLESTIEAPSITRATINYQNVLSALDIAKRTEIIVDKQNQIITQVVSKVEDQNQKVSEVTQTVDELRSHISEIADITTSADGNGSVYLANINEGEPVRLEIRPRGVDIAYLHPRNNLFPSNSLFMPNRKVRFATKDYSIEWEIPANLLYYDAENYDELILDYEGQSCIVNKKVGYNADGTKYLLDKTKTLTFAYPKIPLLEGDYTVTILGYPSAYLFVRLMCQNIYTDQFATKAEMYSTVTQTAESITAEVTKKLTNYSTTVQMNSVIEQKSNSILSKVSETYATKTSLGNYSTTTQMNSAITQKADSILSTVSTTYATKSSLNNYSTTKEMNSAIEQKADSITSSVSTTYLTKTSASNTYATKTQLSTAKSEIKQTTDSISTTVSKKVGYSEVISSINQTAETVKINASKINLNGYLTVSNASSTYATKSGLSGGTTTISGNCLTTGTINASKCTITNINASNITTGTISASKISGGSLNLTGTNTTITSTDFSVDKIGNMICNNATMNNVKINGGKIEISGARGATDLIKIINSNRTSEFAYIHPCGLGFVGTGGRIDITAQGTDFAFSNIDVIDSDGTTGIYGRGITTPSLTQTSLEENKKNFEKLENGLDIIKNTEIYKYNLKSQKDKDKKHIGFVIGKDYRYSSEITAIDKDGKEIGVDTYSMISVAYKAIQELLVRIKKLEGSEA